MRTIYIEPDTYKCHPNDEQDRIAVETDFFDGKCKGFVEGYRYIPDGHSWVDENGVTLSGEMIVVWKNYETLLSLQEQYEEMLAEEEDMRMALETIYGGVTDE